MIRVEEQVIPLFNQQSKKNLNEILAKHNNFQNDYKVINVVGTNGKGSTSYFTSLGLKQNYKKVGLFISPAFIYQNERIQINNEPISDDDFKRILKKFLKEIEENYLNFFEIYTLVAMWYFYEQKIDIAVIEAGIGGLHDTTNLFANQIGTLFTTVGYDHEEILGYKIEEIIFQKVKIAKQGFLISSSSNKKFNKIIKNYIPSEVKFFQAKNHNDEKTFQKINKGLVLKFFEVMNLNFDKKIFLLENPLGRLTILSENPKVIIDGAHNISGIKALIKSAKKVLKNPEIIFAASPKKNFHEVIKILNKNFKKVFYTEFNQNENWNTLKKYEIIDWKEKIKNNLKNKQDTLICGSLYFVPLVYQFIKTEGLDALSNN